MIRSFISVLWMMLAVGLVSGCASAKVKEDSHSGLSKLQKPSIIYVAPFLTETGVWSVGREGHDLTVFKHDSAIDLQKMMVERLADIAPTQPIPDHPVHEGWVIRGHFITVDQGSRAARAVVGFGLGATKIDTHVFVYEAALSNDDPAMEFKTTGGSGSMPGGVAGGMTSAAGSAASGLSDDFKRTAREIRNWLKDRVQ